MAKNSAIIQQDKSLTILLCDLYVENKRAFKCAELLIDLSKDYPKDVEVILLQARLDFSQGKIQQAITFLEHKNSLARNVNMKITLSAFI